MARKNIIGGQASFGDSEDDSQLPSMLDFSSHLKSTDSWKPTGKKDEEIARLLAENEQLQERINQTELQLELISQNPQSLVEQGDLLLGGWKLTSVGLIQFAEVGEQDWQFVGRALKMLEGSLQWLIGDWALHGERVQYGQRREFAETVGYDIRSVEDYVYVASNVDFTVRTVNLSFGHHKRVAFLYDDKIPQESYHRQKVALSYAEEHQLSVADFTIWLSDTNVRDWLFSGCISEMPSLYETPVILTPTWEKTILKARQKFVREWKNMTHEERSSLERHLEELLNQLRTMKK